MSYILKISPKGKIQIPPEVLPHLKADTRYQLEIDGETLILRPQQDEPFWFGASPAQRAARFRAWISESKRPSAPILTDTALSRETIYP